MSARLTIVAKKPTLNHKMSAFRNTSTVCPRSTERRMPARSSKPRKSGSSLLAIGDKEGLRCPYARPTALEPRFRLGMTAVNRR
jgi:hypothetical protein